VSLAVAVAVVEGEAHRGLEGGERLEAAVAGESS
jgi:hypothetical protein